MEENILFTCHLLTTLKREHRVVAVYYDESIDMYLKPEEEPISQRPFSEEFARGMLPALLQEFGREATGEFITHLLEVGMTELKLFAQKSLSEENAEPRAPQGMITPEYQSRYVYLMGIYGPVMLHSLCIQIASIGMEMLAFADVSEMWKYNSPQ